jgi:hypothetical protein
VLVASTKYEKYTSNPESDVLALELVPALLPVSLYGALFGRVHQGMAGKLE